jgi:hypothetical protein
MYPKMHRMKLFGLLRPSPRGEWTLPRMQDAGTLQSEVVADIGAALCRAELQVARMNPSRRQRRLKQLLSVVWRAVASWDLNPPSPRQLALLRGIVDDVRRDAGEEESTKRLRRAQ